MSKKASSSQPREESSVIGSQQVVERLQRLRILQNSRVRTIFEWMPALLVLLVFVDWLIGGGNFSRDTFRMTGILTVALILLAIRILFERFPRALEMIWRRGLVDLPSDDSGAHAFLEYLDQFVAALHSKYAWVVAVLVAAGSLFATYPFQYWMRAERFPSVSGGMLGYYFGQQAGIIAPILGLVVGMLAWRVGVIAYYIGRLGEQFPLRIQINHNDQAGGLKPLGDLTFNIALILLLPAIFLGVWGFVNTIFPNMVDEIYAVLWGALFRQLLVVLGILSLFALIQPVYKIHLRMEECAHQIRAELDSLSLKIEAVSHELRSTADEINPQQGEERLRAIEFMKKVYAENSQMPTWPFNWKTILRFVSAQAIPWLSFMGTSAPVVEIVKAFFSLGN